jgi:hypothetical protein
MSARPLTAVPELGPLLGRLTDTSMTIPRPPLALDDIRYELVTGLFELASAAREFAEAGDLAGSAASLGRRAWLDAWEGAVSAVALRVSERINARLQGAAAESRMPAKQLRRLLLDDEERRGIALRLGVAGGPFVAALDALEATVPAVERGDAALTAWHDALGHVARRLEVAWDALVAAAGEEEAAWNGEIERVRAWRRARWPLWLITAAVLGAAAYLGLVLGGFVSVPGLLRPLAQYWWSR